jgi:hypothetical protein
VNAQRQIASTVQPVTMNPAAGDIVGLDALVLDAPLRPTDPAHVRQLAAVLDDTPPVLVLVDGHRLRLLDGLMRVEAARSLGRSTVRVERVSGEEAACWEWAIRTNSRHGLPLTPTQRRGAARRLLALAPDWSDRRIASACGVDPRSVGRWRKSEPGRAGGEMPHPRSMERVGRDGRRYPSAEELEARRGVARDLLRSEPGLADREIGRRAGLSCGAVRRLRSAAKDRNGSGRHRALRTAAVAALRAARKMLALAVTPLRRLLPRP